VTGNHVPVDSRSAAALANLQEQPTPIGIHSGLTEAGDPQRRQVAVHCLPPNVPMKRKRILANDGARVHTEK